MNVLVYESQLSAVLREPVGLDLKQCASVGYLTPSLSRGLQWGDTKAKYMPLAKGRSQDLHGWGIVKFGNWRQLLSPPSES